jgi:N-acetylglucosamine-6-phosphate deacetylase
MKAIRNGRLICPDAAGDFVVVENQVLLYEKTILAIVPAQDFHPEQAEEILDAAGAYVSPGFLNVHIHGCGGYDTMDDDPAALQVIREKQTASGVTALLPTTMTYDFPRINRALERIRKAMQLDDGAAILGCHMEGPFISEARKGAQAARDIARADFTKIAPYKDVIRMITLAPEELPDSSFIRECHENGIVVSIGHSSADYAMARKAIEEWGITHVTHLFNGMAPFHHREPGIVGAALDTDVNCELIADNIHSHPSAQRMVFRSKGGRHIILVTDSMRACMLGDGVSELGGQKVYVKGQKATLADGTIAGSVLTMDRALANYARNTGSSIPAVVEMVTRTPALELGIYADRGSIEVGKRADLTLFDDQLHIAATIVAGKTQGDGSPV